MRKIKHFAGYGTVMAGKIPDKTCTLHVRVEGNHECGLEFSFMDEYNICNWLVKRFDKSVTDSLEWVRKYPKISVRPSTFQAANGVWTDRCDYLFWY